MRAARTGQGKTFGLATVVAALAALGACTPAQTSPNWVQCKLDGSADGAVAKQKVAACDVLISGGEGRLKDADLAVAFRERAAGERAQNDYDAAIADENRAIKLDPEDGLAIGGRGLAYYGENKLDLAMADFNAALKLDPDDAAALNGRAFVERQESDPADVIRDEDRAIQLKPDWSNPWLERGLAYLDKHWWDMAIADFGDALKHAPALADALDGTGDAERGKGDAADAVRAYLQAADAHFNDKDWSDAIAEAGKALAVSPEDPGALNSRCWTRAVADEDLNLAEADCRHSLKAKPDAPEVVDSLAFVRFRQKRYEDALTGFDAALAKKPTQWESLFMRGIVKQALGDQAGGQADIDAANAKDASLAGRYANWGVEPADSNDSSNATASQ